MGEGPKLQWTYRADMMFVGGSEGSRFEVESARLELIDSC